MEGTHENLSPTKIPPYTVEVWSFWTVLSVVVVVVPIKQTRSMKRAALAVQTGGRERQREVCKAELRKKNLAQNIA